MLSNIRLENFKCFESLDMRCAALTLLCGLNGMGKSSVFQAILALRQTVNSERSAVPRKLLVNGERVNLGTAKDVLYEDAKDEVVKIALTDKGIEKPCDLSFRFDDYTEQLIVEEESQTYLYGWDQGWDNVPPIGGKVVYVDAERVGPRRFYPLAETSGRRGNLGTRSELALAHLVSLQDFVLSEEDPRLGQQPSRRMLSVLEEWLSGVSPGVRLHLEPIVDADALVARFSFSRSGDIGSRPYRATNVGFGLSYTLPVLIALLSPPGTLCLIENPEAHLHPQGQTMLAELAVRASKAGVQVIVETHSDHFMDGVRIAVHERTAVPEDIAFHYFERVHGQSRIVSPKIDMDGRLSNWPAGFFDQHDKNLAKLLVPRR